MTGQLSFTPVDAYQSFIGADAYAIIGSSASQSSQYTALFLTTLTSLGTFSDLSTAINSCQSHFAGLTS
jgi:hypothetical protein